MFKFTAALIIALFLNQPAHAAPLTYALEPAISIVGFETDFGPDKITGQMPITAADLTLDFQNVAASRVSVTLDASSADIQLSVTDWTVAWRTTRSRGSPPNSPSTAAVSSLFALSATTS